MPDHRGFGTQASLDPVGVLTHSSDPIITPLQGGRLTRQSPSRAPELTAKAMLLMLRGWASGIIDPPPPETKTRRPEPEDQNPRPAQRAKHGNSSHEGPEHQP